MNLYAGVAQRIRRELTDIERAVNSALRYLVRNVYTHNLIPEKLEALIDLTPQTWSSVEVEFNNFANLLDQLAEAAERES